MYNTDMPSRAELPSSKQLIGSTLAAIVIAAILLVTVVMPAEYAIDPTGAGRALGLTEMGEIKAQLEEKAAADAAAQLASAGPSDEAPATSDGEPQATEAARQDSAAPTESEETREQSDVADNEAGSGEPAGEAEPTESPWKDEITLTLTPGQGTEFKLTMNEGAVATFSWVSEGGPINYDTHGDGNGQSISYEKGRGVPEDEGELEAAFTGNHGWFFRNRNDQDITLVLKTGGDYGELKKML